MSTIAVAGMFIFGVPAEEPVPGFHVMVSIMGFLVMFAMIGLLILSFRQLITGKGWKEGR